MPDSSVSFASAPLMHGGRLRDAVRRYGIPTGEWMDLSTGINPIPWPVPELSVASWHRLPEEGDGLEAAARRYYGAGELLPVAGSQAAIQALPALRGQSTVAVIAPGYAEHAAAWVRHGHVVKQIAVEAAARAAESADVLVLINPNNPSGHRFRRDQLLEWHGKLARRDGWLVVDEAFMDADSGDSISDATGTPGLIVLRSMGKFFGLAGARVGFVLAWPALLASMAVTLGPWAVSGPAREVARLALGDISWQAGTRQRLREDSVRLECLLRRRGFSTISGTRLFQWVRTGDAPALHDALANAGILVRLFGSPVSLRFGLPATEPQWQRLDDALKTFRR